jgi:hypothetical protein
LLALQAWQLLLLGQLLSQALQAWQLLLLVLLLLG